MLITVIFPFYDLRRILVPGFEPLAKPNWPTPVSGHLRGLGGVAERYKRGFDSWVGENYLIVGNLGIALDLPRALPGWPAQRIRLVRKAGYYDGLASGRFEFLFRLEEPAIGRAQLPAFVSALLARPARVPAFDKGRPPLALERQTRTVPRLWARATTKRRAEPHGDQVQPATILVIAESDDPADGQAGDGANPASLEMLDSPPGKPIDLFLLAPTAGSQTGPRSAYRGQARLIRTYFLRMRQDVEAISRICTLPAERLEDDLVQYVLNEYTRHVNRSRQNLEPATADMVSYCYALFAGIYPGRIAGLRAEVARSRMRPNVRDKLLDLLDRARESMIKVETLIIGGDVVEGDKIEVGDISNSTGIAVGRQATATVTDSGNQGVDPAVIEGLLALAKQVRLSGHDDADVEAEILENAAKKAKDGDEKGAVSYLKKASTWALGLGTTVGSAVLTTYLKAQLGLP